jgi:hypothetical protein
MADDYSAFTPASAPAANDYSRFTPASAPTNDYSKFTPADPPPTTLGGKIMNTAQGLRAQYEQSALGGVLAQPVRYAMEHLDNPVTGGVEHAVGNLLGAPNMGNVDAQLKQQYPNATQDQIDSMKHNVYGNALVGARQQAATDVANHQYGGKKTEAVGNFAANVVAHPENLLLPGGAGSSASGIATRVAASAGANALIAGAEDGAAQIMDMAEGQQKDWDIQRSIDNAKFGAIMGGAIHGAVETPAFVKGLFANRGVDTTPNATPTGSNAPLTTDQPNLTPAEQGQLRELMKTGSVDDIKGFLADKQGPKPSWSAVNKLVQMRDNLQAQPDGFMGQDNTMQAVNEQIQSSRSQAVQSHIEDQTTGWKNAPDIQYHNSVEDMPEGPLKQDVQNKIAQTGKTPPGLYGADGKVHIFTDQVHSPEQANALLFHEGLGHFGLADKFGARLDSTLESLANSNVSQFGKKVAERQAANPGESRALSAEETLAEMSENGPLPKSIGNAVEAHIRRFGRYMGMKLKTNDAEVAHILSMTHDAVINGKSVADNGFRSPLAEGPNDPGNKYMFTGPHATDFRADSDTAFMTRNKDIRNEISDHEAYLRPMAGKTETTLGETLHHPELFEQYPELADMPVHHYPMEDAHGGYDNDNPSIHISSHLDDTDPLKLSTTLHETQHAIQHIEGNIKPGEDNMQSNFDDYRSDPREVEAAETERRKNFTPEARLTEYKAKFMDPDRLAAMGKDVAEETFERYGDGYTPKYRSQADAMKAAQDTALDISELKKTRSVGNLDRKMFVYDNAAEDASNRILALHAKDAAGGLTDEEGVELLQTVANFKYALARLDNDSGQIARAQNAMKQIKFRRNNILALKKALEDDGDGSANLLDPDNRTKYLQQFANLSNNGNPAGAAQMLKGVNKPYWWQYGLTWRNNMMLSALSTHLKSTMDMATTASREYEEKLASMAIAPLRDIARGVGIKNVQPGTDAAEIAAQMLGQLHSIVPAVKDARTAFKNGNTQRFGPNSVQSPELTGIFKPAMIPTKSIAAQDAFYRNVLTNGHLNAIATREAIKTLPKGASFDDKVSAGRGLALAPTKAMLDEAQELASQTMLMNKSPLNDALDRGKRIRPGMNPVEQFGSFMANYLTPFVRVQSNALMNQIVRRSPLSFLDPQTRADWVAGGSRRDVAIARTVIGSGLLAYYWNAADPKNKDAKLTGTGPEENLNKMKEKEAGGWQAGSVHENGQFSRNSNLNISFNPLDLHNNTASLVAGVREAYEAGSKGKDAILGLKLAMSAVMNDLVSQTFVNDIGEAWDAFSKKGETGAQKMGKFIGNEAKSFLPNATTQAAHLIDPVARDTSGGPLQQVQAAVPFASKGLPARQTVYGDDQQTGTGATGIHTWLPQGNHITGGNHTDEPTDPAEVEMSRLGSLSSKPIVGPVEKTISGVDTSNFDPKQITDAGHVRLTPEQFEHYQHVTGVQIKELTRQEMASPSWSQMSDEDKAQWLHQTAIEQRKAVKEYLYGTK